MSPFLQASPCAALHVTLRSSCRLVLKAAALLPLLPLVFFFSWLPLHQTSPGVSGVGQHAAHWSGRKPIYQRKNLGAWELCLLVLTLCVPGLWWLGGLCSNVLCFHISSQRADAPMALGSSVFSKGQEYLKVCIYLIFSRHCLVFSAEMAFRPQAEVRKDPSETCSLCYCHKGALFRI